MRLLRILLGLLYVVLASFKLQAQSKTIATLSSEASTIQSNEGHLSFAYANKILDLAEAHQVQKDFSSATSLINKVNTILQTYADSVPPNYEEEFAIKTQTGPLRLQQIYLVWQGYFWQEKYDTAQAVVEQKEWIERCIRLKLYDKVLTLLETTDKEISSNHPLYLDNWQKAYDLYNSPHLYNLEESERVWEAICSHRAKKNGLESQAHLEVLFGFANFCNRTNKIDRFQSLKTQIETHWPAAFGVKGLSKVSTQLDSTGRPSPTTSDSASTDNKPIFTIVQQMPRHPGCEHLKENDKEKKACADEKLLQFIYSHVKYPSPARKEGIEGMVVIAFVVTEYGTISNIEIIRNPGGYCGEEALRVVKLLNELPVRWLAGKQDDKIVRVKYHLPVRFKLN